MKTSDHGQENNKWYVVQCKTGREKYLDLMLKTLGIVTYLPLVKKYKHRAPVYVSLFPGYIFINVDFKIMSLSSINYFPSVVRILSIGNDPLVLEDEIVEAIAQELERLNNQPGNSHGFQPNDILRIRNGPLRGMEVIFIGPTTPSRRVRVFLEFLGGPKETLVNVDALEGTAVEVGGDKKKDGKRQRYTRGKGRRI